MMMLSSLSVIRLFIACVLILGVACEEPLRLPYIEPILHNWPEQYRGLRGMKLQRLSNGLDSGVRAGSSTEDGSLPQQHTLDILVFGH